MTSRAPTNDPASIDVPEADRRPTRVRLAHVAERTPTIDRRQAAELLQLAGLAGHQLTEALAERLGGPALAANSTLLLIGALAVEGPLRPRDLLPVTGVTSGGMTRQLDRLEALGLIDRTFGTVTGDRRAIRVSLTKAGRHVAEEAASALESRSHLIHELADRALELVGGSEVPDAGASAVPPSRWRDGGSTLRSADQATRSATSRPGTSVRRLYLLGRFGSVLREAALRAAADVDLVDNLPVAVLCTIDTSGPVRPVDLVGTTGLSSGGVTKLLDRLEGRGLVMRQHGAVDSDRRAIVVSMAPAGGELLDRFAAVLVDRREALVSLLLDIRATP